MSSGNLFGEPSVKTKKGDLPMAHHDRRKKQIHDLLQQYALVNEYEKTIEEIGRKVSK